MCIVVIVYLSWKLAYLLILIRKSFISQELRSNMLLAANIKQRKLTWLGELEGLMEHFKFWLFIDAMLGFYYHVAFKIVSN